MAGHSAAAEECPERYILETCAPLPWVARLGHQTRVLHRDADREVIKTLKGMSAETEHVVHGIVVEAADAGRPGARRFGCQVERLPHDTALPKQVAIERGAELVEAGVERRDHPQAE